MPATIYLDHAASSPIRPGALQAMTEVWALGPGNPASTHHAGRRHRRILEDAREQVARLLGAFPDEVVFTSGATESNNLALVGLAAGLSRSERRWLVSPIEHSSVRQPIESTGEITFCVKPGWDGSLALDALVESLSTGPVGVATLQMANQETGAVQPVIELGEVIESRFSGWKLHVDATQAVGKMPVSFHRLRATTLAASAHKFGGPIGVGLLLVRRGTALVPLQKGGGQQGDRRAGTESAALAAGLATALQESTTEMASFRERSVVFRADLLTRLRQSGIAWEVNSPESGLPHLLNLSFAGVRSDTLLMALDLEGVAISAGSACASGSIVPSPVLVAMGLPEERVGSAIRLSWGWNTQPGDLEEAAQRIIRVVRRLCHAQSRR